MKTRVMCAVVAMALSALFGCGKPNPGELEPGAGIAPAAASNRIDLPPNVRQNLGITFAKVERRPVRQTIRVPGEFRLRHEARREYHAMVPGRVELLAKVMEPVKAGQVLARLDSPDWRQRQHEAVEAEGEIKLAEAALQVAEASRVESEQAAVFLRSRLEKLNELGVRRVELEGDLATRESQLPKLEAEVRAKRTELEEAREHYQSMLNILSSLSGVSRDQLLSPRASADGEAPFWRSLDRLSVVAEADGVIETIAVTQGGWLETGAHILSTIDPSLLHFHADAPQADIGRFAGGQRVKIVPPQGGSVDMQHAINGVLHVGAMAHPEERTIALYAVPQTAATWAKPGVTAYLEVFVGGTDQPELAIPASSIVRDELNLVFYRRDPRDADKVYPVEADLGASDGRWTVVNSGVADGDEVVLDGAYSLKLIGGKQQAPAGYHYHADGSLHKDH